MDPLSSSSGDERVFKAGSLQLTIIVAMIALPALVPLQSLHELITTGTIDLEAVNRTRRQIPVWQLYTGGWVCFAFCLWVTRPALRYFWNREVFRLGPQGITIRGTTLAPEEVLEIRRSLVHGHVLCSTRGNLPFMPYMVKGGPEALAAALQHITPLQPAKPLPFLGN